MKKILMTLLALTLLMGAAATANAIDFKAKGLFMFAFDYNYGGSFLSKDRQGKKLSGSRQQGPHYPMDNFAAWQRFLVGFDAIASETLSGSIMFEIGDQFWGQGRTGGALGADGVVIEVKNAYVDWTVPNTSLKLRMGIQGLVLPGFSFRGSVLNDDMAAITASYSFDDTISATAFWARPYNDNFAPHNDNNDPVNYMDNLDLFGLMVPLNYDGVKVTPWGMLGMLGSNVMSLSAVPGAYPNTRDLVTNPRVVNSQAPQEWAQFTTGMLPAALSAGRRANFDYGYATAFWVGITGEVTVMDPWRIAWDVNYGNVSTGKSYLNRSGWLANLLVEYQAEWGRPGIYGWYTTGDDDDINNGSEQMPYVSTVNINTDSYSNFGFRGTPWFNNSGVLGGNPQGMWGIGARIRDMNFTIPGLKSTVLVNFFGGTNDPKMASYILGRRTTDENRQVYRRWTDFTANPASGYGVYLTQADTGIEVNWNNLYKIYENLTMLVEVGYIHLWMDEGTWGRTGGAKADNLNYQDAWKVSVGFAYSF